MSSKAKFQPARPNPGRIPALLICLVGTTVWLKAGPLPDKILPLPGETFEVSRHPAFLIPGKTTAGQTEKPWVWYAPTLPGLPGPEEKWMFEQFRDAGIAIAGIDAGESYGSPAGQILFSGLYQELTDQRGYSHRPVLLGRSRGGLMMLAWAAANPDKVGAFAGIYPVCNLGSYPGVAQAAGAFGLKEEDLQNRLAEFNPIDRLAPLAREGVPLFAIHGDLDTVVPLEANSGLMRERYEKLGGRMQLIVPPGQGHNMWEGFFHCQALVKFVVEHANPALTLTAPGDFQIIQRSGKDHGVVKISGTFSGGSAEAMEARFTQIGSISDWQSLAVIVKGASFSASLEMPAGGWWRLEVRGISQGKPIGSATVGHVGIGEVFVIAGQSNSANYGEEKQQTRTGMVAAFDGRNWRIAHDPQPGAGGGGGSFLPSFGDAMAEKFHVPIGIVSCGVGATSVREWLPAGTKFPNPPTLTGNVEPLPTGEWQSKGDLFANFTRRLQALGPQGFRAVLWHQGESDANQADSTRTLPGELYHDCLARLIRESRQAMGWEAPWFVAQASYHVPGDEGSPEIRAAQAALWKEGLALEGPDSDALRGGLRESSGKGVHFSGPGLREHGARWSAKVSPWLEKQLQ